MMSGMLASVSFSLSLSLASTGLLYRCSSLSTFFLLMDKSELDSSLKMNFCIPTAIVSADNWLEIVEH